MLSRSTTACSLILGLLSLAATGCGGDAVVAPSGWDQATQVNHGPVPADSLGANRTTPDQRISATAEPTALAIPAPAIPAPAIPAPAIPAPATEELLPPAEPDTLVYPSTEQWVDAGVRQRARAERSFVALKQRKLPAYQGPLFVDDDQQVQLQDAHEVARRALVLWAVALRAEGTPRAEVIELIRRSNSWDAVSPSEKQFLEIDHPDPTMTQALLWRLESLWVLLWALGHVEQLDWPSDMCNVPRLVEIMRVQEANPAFISKAKLRGVEEILDAQDLTMRIHWAVREASLHQPPRVPADLDWSTRAPWVPIVQSPGVAVVEERHHALNWLVNFLQPENWDEVDTPT